MGRAAARAHRRGGRHDRARRLRHPGQRHRTTTARVRPDLVVRLVGGKNVVVDSKVAFSALPRGDGGDGRADPRQPAQGARPAPAHHIDVAGGQGVLGAVQPRRRSSSSASCRPTRSSTRRCARTRPCSSTPSPATSCWPPRSRWSRCCAPSPTPGGRRRWPPTPREVQQLGRDLYQRLSTMGGHIDKLGRSLGTRGRRVQRGGRLAGEPGAESRPGSWPTSAWSTRRRRSNAPDQLTESPASTQAPS